MFRKLKDGGMATEERSGVRAVVDKRARFGADALDAGSSRGGVNCPSSMGY